MYTGMVNCFVKSVQSEGPFVLMRGIVSSTRLPQLDSARADSRVLTRRLPHRLHASLPEAGPVHHHQPHPHRQAHASLDGQVRLLKQGTRRPRGVRTPSCWWENAAGSRVDAFMLAMACASRTSVCVSL